MLEALTIEVHGVVQGVGFRPFVYRAATHHLINGWVLNATTGVHIHAEGESKNLDEFIMELSENAPAAARVKEIEMHEVPLESFSDFTIRYSTQEVSDTTTLVSPDLATCDECIDELFDPLNRRYHYPFINCTNCGPRFTIIDELPYDRCHTSMHSFTLCNECAHEYENPLDRRFHAQPDACFECGPHISWKLADQDDIIWGTNQKLSDEIIHTATALLQSGGIVAIKGLGGFHIACDATNPEALACLRTRKHRFGKAFAVMVRTMDEARELCEINDAEERLLKGSAHPIVLCKKRSDTTYAPGLADGLGELGIMLAYTPLQHLVLADFGGPLVMTSGNMHDEPIQIDDEAAYSSLSGIIDGFIGNNRPIKTRFDDSVVRVITAASAGDAVQVIRRARGFAPMPLSIKRQTNTSSILACGPEQKNTFCMVRGGDAFVSQHIGDMENAQTYDAWLETKSRFESLFEIKPQHIALDMHPEYLTSKWAESIHTETGIDLVKVQHHHAHIASVMAENEIEDATIGIAFDGTGYGSDGAIWGGEVMLCNLTDFERFANIAYMPMPGGAAAIKNPLRMAYGILWASDLLEHPGAAYMYSELGESAQICDQMIERSINCPFTSSVGRLFDAASALCAVCPSPTYEGQAAIMFEAAMYGAQAESVLADAVLDDERYHIDIVKNMATEESTAHDTSVLLMDPAPLFSALLDDISQGVAVPIIAMRFHLGIVAAIIQMCQIAQAVYGISTVALSGGVFMNRFLIQNTIAQLEACGFTVAINKELPPNDGAISFGQAAIAAARL